MMRAEDYFDKTTEKGVKSVFKNTNLDKLKEIQCHLWNSCHKIICYDVGLLFPPC